jgi:hypothetical protein
MALMSCDRKDHPRPRRHERLCLAGGHPAFIRHPPSIAPVHADQRIRLDQHVRPQQSAQIRA